MPMSGGPGASAGDVPALHSLRVHASHLGQVQQGIGSGDQAFYQPVYISSLFQLSMCSYQIIKFSQKMRRLQTWDFTQNPLYIM